MRCKEDSWQQLPVSYVNKEQNQTVAISSFPFHLHNLNTCKNCLKRQTIFFNKKETYQVGFMAFFKQGIKRSTTANNCFDKAFVYVLHQFLDAVMKV